MDDFTFEIDNYGQMTIVSYTGPGGDVVVPDTINGLPVTRIWHWAFGGNPHITSITLPNSITNIGEKAFKNCSGLTKIYMPERTGIDEGAFIGCASLVSITIGDDPDQVYTAENFMFQYYTGTIALKQNFARDGGRTQ